MFEILLAGRRLPRANYSGVFGNYLQFDPKQVRIWKLNGDYMVQDEKSIHFRVLGGTYLSHDEKSISVRSVRGEYIASDAQFDRIPQVGASYMTLDDQSFLWHSQSGHYLVNDGDGGLLMRRAWANLAVEATVNDIGIGCHKGIIANQQQGRVAPIIVGQVAVPTIRDTTARFIGHIGQYTVGNPERVMGVGTSIAHLCLKDEPSQRVGIISTIALVAFQDARPATA